MKRLYCNIDIDQFKKNIRAIRSSLEQKTKFLLSVKCDGYGIGMVEAAKAAEQENVDFLGTASLDEALELRNHNIRARILVFSQPYDSEFDIYIKHNITPSIYTYETAETLNKMAKASGDIFNIHFNVDTGMGRNGLQPEDAFDHLQRVLNLPYLNVEGIYTHMAEGSKPFSSYTHSQIRTFVKFVQRLKQVKREAPILHAANTDTFSNFPQYMFDMVRIGLKAYENVMSLKTTIGFIKQMKAGDYIGYERSHCLKNDASVAVVNIGYGDGYPFELSNKGTVLIGGNFYPIIGRVCMDHIMVNLGENLQKFDIGEDVIALGTQGNSKITVDDLARLAKTIPYEILTRQANRTNKTYITAI